MVTTLALAAIFMQQASIEGNPRASVRVVIYEDLQCSDCAALRNTMDSYFLPKFGEKVAFEHRDFPLPKHEWARKAAYAARQFDRARPGAGLDFRRYVLQRVKQISPEMLDERIREFAVREGLDPIDALRAGTDPTIEAAVEKDYREGIARGVSKTPTVYVGDKIFIERFTRDALAAAITAEIEKASKQ